jgi:hypothetical protein
MRNATIDVGDRVRTGGGTPAARKYAGQESRVEAIEPAFNRIRLFYVRIDGDCFETAFEEIDLVHRILKGGVPGLGFARRAQEIAWT